MAQDDIQGTVVDSSGTAVSGAIVEVVPASTDGSTTEETVVRTTTDSNGDYIIDYHPNGDGTTQDWHVTAYNWDGSNWVPALNKPGVSADLDIAIPDSGMFQSPLYQYTAVGGLSVSSGEVADNWTEQLAGAGDATAVGGPTYRSDQSGFESVEYDGTDDGHDFPSDGQLPTGNSPVSFAATVYLKSTNTIQFIVAYGDNSTNGEVRWGFEDDSVRIGLNGTGTGKVVAGSASTGSWITVGGVMADNDTEAYLNGLSVGTDSGSPNLADANRGIGYRPISGGNYVDLYLYDLVICDARESDQAFSDYHTNRLG